MYMKEFYWVFLTAACCMAYINYSDHVAEKKHDSQHHRVVHRCVLIVSSHAGCAALGVLMLVHLFGPECDGLLWNLEQTASSPEDELCAQLFIKHHAQINNTLVTFRDWIFILILVKWQLREDKYNYAMFPVMINRWSTVSRSKPAVCSALLWQSSD